MSGEFIGMVWRWGMLTIRTCKVFSHALGEYLRQADYYSQGMKVEGQCFGQLCLAVGLVEGATISDEAFERVAGNHHAATGEQLTERMAAARRAGYDATFNAPKSVSIQAFIGGDARLVAAHEAAVKEALRELETFACHQDGRGINKRYVTSGKIAAGVFRHGESRALDTHLHSHAFVFNVVQSGSSSRLLALESSNIFERARYLTEVYRNALAREVQKLGYEVQRREHGFELAGISPSLLERFSKRAKERDAAISVREAELGRELTRDEIAVLVRENRAKKQYELTPEDLRQRQFAQVTDNELRQLHALRDIAKPVATGNIPLAVAIERAVEHVFERKTVVPVHELTAEILRQSYGHRTRLHNACNFQGISNRRCEEQPRNPGLGHEFGFRNRRNADTDGSGSDLTARDLHALVRFRVRSQMLAGFRDTCGHACEIGLKLV